jgi:hypothetical protein
MTPEKIAKFSRWFVGLTFIFMGLLCATIFVFIFFGDDRSKMVVVAALQIPCGVFLIWHGAMKIYGTKRAA